MENKAKKPTKEEILRSKAENIMNQKRAKTKEEYHEADFLKLIHEFEVHQIELGLQSEELQISHNQVTELKDKYQELYDFAPSGYFTLSREGEILELNLTGAQILGKERLRLYKANFGFFVSSVSKHTFSDFATRVLTGKARESCEIVVTPEGALPKHLLLNGIKANNRDGYFVTAHDITERKLAESILQDIIENNPMSIQIVDRKGCTIKSNPSFRQLFGSVPPPDFSIFDDLCDKHPELKPYIKRALKGEMVRLPDISYNVAESNDAPLWISAIIFPLNDGNGTPDTFVIMHDNISERKLAEEKISLANNFLDTIIENIPDMVFLKDALSLRFVQFNRAAEELLGIPRSEMIGKNDFDFFPKEYAQAYTEKDRVVLSGKKMVDISEEILQTKHKGLRTLHTKKVPVLNSKGEPEYLLGISEDITELKSLADNKRVSDERYRLLTDQSPIAIEHYDEHGKLIMVNPACLSLFGAKNVSEIIGFNLFEDPNITEDIKQRILRKETVNFQIQFDFDLVKEKKLYATSKSGAIWIDIIINPVTDAAMVVNGYLAHISDISERKQSEDTIREYTLQLENMNSHFIGREIKMIELKNEINELLVQSGREEKYIVHE